MKLFVSTLYGLFFSFFLISCQKEASFESGQAAKGSLQNDASGDCLPKRVFGTYIANAGLSDSNFIEIDVNVSTTGAYTIVTDTVNGYFFKGSGNFSTTGSNRVKLKASGKPLAAGTNDFLITYDSSFCYVEVPVLPAGSTGGPATFTLAASGASCMDAAVSGNYAKTVALTSANTVAVKVNVTAPGSYTITTSTANGMQFSGTGTLAAAGPQVISLTGSGTPTNEGNTTFTLTAGASTCTFSLTVTAANTPPPVVTGDLFPMTKNSWWSYEEPTAPGDTIKRTNVGTVTRAGQTYHAFQNADDLGAIDSSFYRKSGNDYFEYGPADTYTILALDNPQKVEILFLKENATAGMTWNSAEYTGAIVNMPVKIRYAFTCTVANTTATVNGKSFAGVYKIAMKPQYNNTGGTTFTNTGETIEFWYAKGIGFIYAKDSFNGNSTAELRIRNWKVL